MRSPTYALLLRRTLAAFPDQNYPKPLPSSDKIKDLPAELVFNITDQLTPEHVMSLSLASSRLRRVLHDRVQFMKRSKENLRRLLLLLERNSPSLLACFVCHKLYDWRKSNNYACPDYSPITHQPSLGFNNKLSCVHPAVIDLIFRANKLGTDFGLPISYLDCPQEDLISTRSQAEVHRISQARLRNDLLILCCSSVSTIYINKGIEEQLAPLKATSCGHVNYLLTRAITDLQDQVLDLLDQKVKKYDIYGANSYNCTECATDIHIVLRTHKDDFPKVYMSVNILHKFNARTSARLTPRIDFQDENIIQSATPIPNLTISRDLLASFLSWEASPISTYDRLCRWAYRKWFMDGWKRAEPVPDSPDGQGLQIRVHL